MPPRINDENIADEDLLWRRICDNPVWVTKTEDGGIKLSSAAFLDNYTNEVSVNVALLTTVDEVLKNYPDMGLVSIKAQEPRALNHIIALTPEVDDPSHRVICPPSNLDTTKKRKSAARLMAEKAVWVTLPNSHRE